MTKRYWWVIITYIIMQFSGVVVAQALLSLSSMSRVEIQYFLVYWSIFSFIACLIVVLFLMKPDMKVGSARGASKSGNAILWSILGLFMAYFSQAIAVTLETKLFGISQGSQNTQDIMNITRMAPLFMVIPMIIAPILEEIIFRKIIFGSLYKRTNFFIAGLLSAFIFGIIHGEPKHILIYAGMGFVFAFLYVKTKRIIVPIIVHMAMNSITVLLQYNLSPEDIEQMQQQLQDMQMIFIGG